MANTFTKSLFAFSIILTLAPQAFAATPAAKDQKSCAQIVQATKEEWNAIGYQTPSKPTAMRVSGKYGHENTAGQVAYMQNQMKLAEADCNAGNQQSAIQRVGSIHAMLDARGTAPETANAAMAPTSK